MNILSITCSESVGSVSFSLNHDIRTVSWSSPKTHSESITKALDECLKSDFSTIDLIAVDVGPGSFTGIRVALGSARTLAYSHNLQMYLCSSIKLLANQINYNTASGYVYVVQNAFTGKFFFGKYKLLKKSGDNLSVDKKHPELEEVISPCVVSQSRLDSELSLQDGILISSYDFILEGYQNFEQLKLYPSSETLISLASNERGHSFVSWTDAEPLYLRASSAEEKFRP